MGLHSPGLEGSVLCPVVRQRSQAELPCKVREIENQLIPMSDGTRLAARIWLPEDALLRPVPAILEYLPYRKRDGYAESDTIMHPYFTGHGYATIRADIRGSGESEGLLWDEYLKQEQDDALELIAWIAAQRWCSGAVGMMGYSWGGFNGLQIAARRPPALRAVISLCSTDDRYADDTHFMGGAVLVANFTWASTMFAGMTRPPDPALVGEQWRNMWLERLRNLPLFIANWLAHQRRDDYWRHGSICEEFQAIECPVFLVGGWHDSYCNTIARMMDGLKVPRRALVGPWSHSYPHVGLPGPRIGFLHECLRWWDQWLKGIETGIMGEAALRAWVPEHVRPAPNAPEEQGRWIAEPEWPTPHRPARKLFLTSTGLADGPTGETPHLIGSPESLGAFSGIWCPYGAKPDGPSDQREEDGRSLVFDTGPLTERLEVLGSPLLEIDVASDQACGKLIARLCDVHPDGASTRVTYGILNLTHRDSHETPSPLEPGRRYRVTIRLNDVAYAFGPEHHIRLALSTTYWPLTWPSPQRVCLTAYSGRAFVRLPVRSAQAWDASPPSFPPAEIVRPEPITVQRPAEIFRRLIRDVGTGETTYRMYDDDGRIRFDSHGLEMGSVREHIFRIHDDDPLSASAQTHWVKETGRGSWQVRTVTRATLTSTPESFVIHAELDAYEGDRRVYSNNWHHTVRRDLV